MLFFFAVPRSRFWRKVRPPFSSWMILPTGPRCSPDDWIAGSLSNATLETGEPLIPGVSSGQTTSETWTAPSNGIASLSIESQTFSPLLTVYAGTAFDNLSLVASNNYLICYSDGECGCHWRERQQITFHVASGQAYQFCVDSAIITDAAYGVQATPITIDGETIVLMTWGPTFTTNVLQGGPFTLAFQFTPAPPNDDFINRTPLVPARELPPRFPTSAPPRNPANRTIWGIRAAVRSGFPQRRQPREESPFRPTMCHPTPRHHKAPVKAQLAPRLGRVAGSKLTKIRRRYFIRCLRPTPGRRWTR